MKTVFRLFPVLLFFLSCGTSNTQKPQEEPDFTIAFGSCNREDEPQPLWSAILKNDPDVFLWGGDNIYSDTNKKLVMQAAYEEQKNNAEYQKLLKSVPVYGTWDDHDFGLNNGGKEWDFKNTSQQLFLDFMEVPANSERRNREGVYSSEIFETEKGSIKVILLDTRYFRDNLILSEDRDQRYEPSSGTILGEEQWEWLEDELRNSEASFNVILSSIQVLSAEHGFETWGNFPSEVDKLKDLIVASEAKNVFLLSGDRHISEFSGTKVEGLGYELIDFTSSGLTHSYDEFRGEPNKHRIGDVIKYKSFGILKFNFSSEKVIMEMRGERNKLQQEYVAEFQ